MKRWSGLMLFMAYVWLLFATLDLVTGSPVLTGFDLVIASGVRLIAYQFAREKRKVTS